MASFQRKPRWRCTDIRALEQNRGIISARVARVPASVMLSLADKIREMRSSGEKIIDLSLGQPETPAPKHISHSMIEALSKPETKYSSSAGSGDLRRLIALDLEKRSGAKTEAREIIATSGSKHALFITLISLVDPGEEVLVFDPYFPPYSEILGLVGGSLKTVPINVLPNALKPNVDDFLAAIGKKTKAVLLNYPNNPAGWTLSRSQVKRIVDYCVKKGVYVISDEIYDQIVFDDVAHCPAWSFSTATQYVIHLGSFSKTYSMVPYRLGFVAARSKVSEEILKAQRATVTMVSPYIQSAGCAALSGPQKFVKSRLAKYQERRDRCLEILSDSGLKCPKPEGAFYLFLPIPGGGKIWRDAFDFATKFLDQYKVAVLPGGIFGKRWKNYIRISFATKDSELYDALRRLGEFCRAGIS